MTLDTLYIKMLMSFEKGKVKPRPDDERRALKENIDGEALEWLTRGL